MSLSGTLGIDITCTAGLPPAIHFTPTRPLPFDRLFAGQGVRGAAVRASQLFAICGHAHAVALEMAFEAAEGTVPDDATRLKRQILVAAEALREHAMRMLIHWPELAGEPADHGGMRLIMAAFQDVVTSGKTSGIADLAGALVLPAGTRLADLLSARLRDDKGDEPGMDDGTVLGRQAANPALKGRGLARRLQARLLESQMLTDFLGDARLDGSPLPAEARGGGDGRGRAYLDVARGRLVHRVAVENGLITGIEIVAPTLENFAAGGVAERAIRAIAVNDGNPGDREAFEWQARLAILEVDPCIPHAVRFTHA